MPSLLTAESCLVSLLQSFINLKKVLCSLIYLCMCVWRAEDNLQKTVLSYQHVGPKDWTQVLRRKDKTYDPLSQFTDHFYFF